MKYHLKPFLAILLIGCLGAGILGGCGNSAGGPQPGLSQNGAGETGPSETAPVPQDYASMVKLNMASETAKQEVTVKTFVDGDTTHFFVPSSMDPDGVMKVRYLAINTPESTGKVEEYGEAASEFTRARLESAESIILESETDSWNTDSTGTRYLCWVWYRMKDQNDYRNLNIEILQNGLARGNATAANRYGSMASAALTQAMDLHRNLYSGKKDPDFYYGEAVKLTLRELRMHIRDYEGKKVAFTANVVQGGDNCVYAEQYDQDLDLYFGICVYYGFHLPGEGMEILSIGNEVRIVGTVQYYEPGDSWQISGVKYRAMKPDDPDNLQKLSGGHQGAFRLTDARTLINGKVSVETEQGMEDRNYGELSMGSTISMKNLKVQSVSTTSEERSASRGSMTLKCSVDGVQVPVRTAVLRDENGKLITEETFLGKTMDVRGVISSFHGEYQIQVSSMKDIFIH